MTRTRPPRRETVVSLSHKAADRLRDMIVFLELRPGEQLSEPRLVEVLGTSRTPVREALKLLAAEHLVLLRRNRAAVVAPLDGPQLHHLFEVEALVESSAAALAALRMSDAAIERLERLQEAMEARHARGDRNGYIRLNQKIHAAIVEGCGNPALVEVHARLIGRLHRARNVALSTLGRIEESIHEHRQILAALRAHDAARAERLFRDHVTRTGELVAAHCAGSVSRRRRDTPIRLTAR